MVTQLNEMASIRTGLVISRKKAQLDSGYKIEYEQISLRCFGAGVKLDKTQKDIFVSSEEIDGKYFTQEGDVVVRLRAPSSAVYIEKEDVGLLIHSLLAVIRVDSNVLDAKYLSYYINAHSAQRILKQDVKGTAIPMLKTKDLEQLKITLPPIEKQKELVKFLELSDKERKLLLHLAHTKQQLSQTILNTIIQQYKEDK
ncbi:MAG: restriction endonuclease subunit S [Sulfurovum sp.]|nr:restriction endonuclease subunit S [Sulfurovum sp.]MCB4774611.1 restriction endonuclease subunit S [Sulfurovum sp.]MCB4781087.1 restriction endonuclease subunit S [Sulfurovum sp.]